MLLSRREYAKHRGVDDKAVRNAIASGRITTTNGMIDPEIADKQWEENTKHEYRPRAYSNADSASSISQSNRQKKVSQSNRQKKETLEILLKKLEYEEKSGKLMPRAEMETDVFNAARAARDKWRGAPRRIAPQVIGKTDIAEIERILNKEFNDFLELLTSCLRGNK